MLTCACVQCKQKLAALADWRVKKSKEEIAKALSYTCACAQCKQWSYGLYLYSVRSTSMYELSDSFDIYQTYVKKMEECLYCAKHTCDKKMEELMRAHIVKLKKPQTLPPPLLALGAAHVEKEKKPGKNAPKISTHKLSWQWNQEVDLLSTAYFVPKGHKYAVQVLEVSDILRFWRLIAR